MRYDAGSLLSLLEVDLYAAGWDGFTETYPGKAPEQVALASLYRSLVKKYLPGTTPSNPKGDEAALALFLQVNERCGSFLSAQPVTLVEEIALGEAKAFLHDFFWPRSGPSMDSFALSSWRIMQGVNVGPGASIGARETDFYTKLASSTLTTTDQSLYDFYTQTISRHPTWANMEFVRSQLGIDLVSSSRLSFVPKSTEISRTICTEPSLNMFVQLGIGGALKDRLREVVGINLTTQPDENRRLCRNGSLTGKFGTIDLSSASDSMSINLVKEFFPSRVFDLLMRTRSPSTILPDGRTIDLHMISSMGNGFTFPLQTIFFTALVYGAYKLCGIPFRHFRGRSPGSSTFAVFGDDIIVDRKAYDLVCKLLVATGFRVNVDKSFNEGFFRESCGKDYYLGHNVRGVYCKSLRHANDLYSLINRLNRWSAEHLTPLPALVGYLRKGCRFLPIPFEEDDSYGIKVPFSLLQRPVRGPNIGTFWYRYSFPIPRSVKAPEVEKRELPFGWIYNPSGVLLSLLRGSISGGRISLRSLDSKAVIRKKCTPRWGYIPSEERVTASFAHDWQVMCELNLGSSPI